MVNKSTNPVRPRNYITDLRKKDWIKLSQKKIKEKKIIYLLF